MGDLGRNLKQALVKNVDSKFYLPEQALLRILTDDAVEKCIRCADIEEYRRHGCIRAVLGGGRRVLALLIMLNKVEVVQKFVETDQLPRETHLDSRLPFEREALQRILGDDIDVIFDIMKTQWEVMTPYFQEDQIHRRFQADVVMPFIHSEWKGGGGFGDVFEVTLPDTHHGFACQGKGHVRKLIALRLHLTL